MKRKYALILLAAAMALSACGKVEEPSTGPSAIDDVTTSDETTETTAQEDEIVPDEETTSNDEYYDEILSDPFGFEIYYNGHLSDTWDYRYDAARLMLEAVAQPGTEEGEVDFEYTLEQLNGFESEGFMAHIKFEDEKTFKVGSWEIDGVCLMIAGDDDECFFWIEYFNEDGDYRSSSYFNFDTTYIPKLLRAVNYGGISEENVVEELPIAPQEDEPMSAAGTLYDIDIYFGGEHNPDSVDADTLQRLIFEALADKEIAENAYFSGIDEGWMDYCQENGLWARIDFGVKTPVTLGNEEIEMSVLTFYGCSGDYCILWDDGDRVPIWPDQADEIINKSCG